MAKRLDALDVWIWSSVPGMIDERDVACVKFKVWWFKCLLAVWILGKPAWCIIWHVKHGVRNVKLVYEMWSLVYEWHVKLGRLYAMWSLVYALWNLVRAIRSLVLWDLKFGVCRHVKPGWCVKCEIIFLHFVFSYLRYFFQHSINHTAYEVYSLSQRLHNNSYKIRIGPCLDPN